MWRTLPYRPAGDGLALLRETKARRPELPVTMVGAYGDEGRRRQAHDTGAAGFITNPIDFEALKAQLRQLPGPGMPGVAGPSA